MIVVDTNLVAYVLVEGEYSADARQVLARDPEWVAPSLWRSELRNTLLRYIRSGAMSLADAIELQEMGEELVGGREYDVASDRVFRLAVESGRSAYDCEFVAVAEQLRVRLVTADRPVLRAFPLHAMSIEDFAQGK